MLPKIWLRCFGPWGITGNTAKLRLLNTETKQETVINKAAMTKENRRVVWENQHKEKEMLTKNEPPKLSPFTDVRFSQDRVMVTYEKSEYEWLGFDDLDVTDIVASAKKQFGDLWKKRVAEDLVEVLWGMGHHPGNTAKLRLLSTETKQERIVWKAAMTKENRREVHHKRGWVEDGPAKEVLADPVSYFDGQLKSRWAYYAGPANKVGRSSAELRKRMAANPGKVHLPLELQKIMARGDRRTRERQRLETGGSMLALFN